MKARLGLLAVTAALTAMAFAGDLAPAYGSLVKPVLAARCQAAARRRPAKIGPDLKKILGDKTAVGDEALAALLQYDLGEEPKIAASAQILERGERMLPVLDRQRETKPPLPNPCQATLLPEDQQKAAYSLLIDMIKSGDRNQ